MYSLRRILGVNSGYLAMHALTKVMIGNVDYLEPHECHLLTYQHTL
jgi:hypothetical protein